MQMLGGYSTNVNQSEQAAIQDGKARYDPVISGQQLCEVLSSDDRSLAARARRLGRARSLRWSDSGTTANLSLEKGQFFSIPFAIQFPVCQ